MEKAVDFSQSAGDQSLALAEHGIEYPLAEYHNGGIDRPSTMLEFTFGEEGEKWQGRLD